MRQPLRGRSTSLQSMACGMGQRCAHLQCVRVRCRALRRAVRRMSHCARHLHVRSAGSGAQLQGAHAIPDRICCHTSQVSVSLLAATALLPALVPFCLVGILAAVDMPFIPALFLQAHTTHRAAHRPLLIQLPR